MLGGLILKLSDKVTLTRVFTARKKIIVFKIIHVVFFIGFRQYLFFKNLHTILKKH